MSNRITGLWCAFVLGVSQVAWAERAQAGAVNVEIDVPNPGWSISIESMHTKGDKLLVVCRASKAEGMHMSMISKAKANAEVSDELAKMPREIYLLGSGWNWSKGYTSVTAPELKKKLAGSQVVELKKEDKKVRPEAQDFVGMKYEDAERLAKKHKLRYRVVMIDGEPQAVTRDLRPDRLNFVLVKGKVTKVTKG